jgi:hypothetical protein
MTLEVTVDSRATGGLRVIRHLPAFRPCQLEGKNGVGKSALIRLLVLASGEQPYQSDAGAWRSLKQLVGPTVLTLDGLAKSGSARLDLTPDKWPDEPVNEIGPWLGAYSVAGHERPISELFKTLDVVHIAGTERLTDTLRQRKNSLVVAVGETSRQLQLIEDQRAELGEVAERLEQLSPRRAQIDTASKEKAVRDREAVSKALADAQLRLEDLQRAAGLRALVDAAKNSGAEEQLAQLRSEMAEARSSLVACESAHEAAVRELTKGTQAQKTAARIERRLSAIGKSLESLDSRQSELALLMEQIGLEPSIEVLDANSQAVLDAAIGDARQAQREAMREAARNSRSGAENVVLDELGVVLDGALERDLGELLLAEIDGVAITVAALSDSLGVVDANNSVTAEELAAANRRVADLSDLARVLSDRVTVRAEQQTSSDDLAKLSASNVGHDELRENASQARKDLDEASARVRALNMQLGALSRAGLTGADALEAETQIQELLTTHGVASEDLAASLIDSQAAHSSLASRDSELKGLIRDLGNRTHRRRVERESLRRRSIAGEESPWVAELASKFDQKPADLDDADWTDAIWQALADHVAAIRTASAELVDRVESLETIGSSHGHAGPIARALDAIVEQDALELLSAPAIADALFGGGDVTRVNLEDGSISWRMPDGETRTRPLSAFSSGEQAFGFMRARLQQIAAVPTEHRLVFLDEFGAFIAADRRRPLAELLTSDALQDLKDQIVVVLPLQADYEDELKDTTGELHAQFERRAQAVAADGYFTEVFEG